MDERSEETPHQQRNMDGNKHMKRCSASYATMKLQMKTMSYYSASVRMAKV